MIGAQQTPFRQEAARAEARVVRLSLGQAEARPVAAAASNCDCKIAGDLFGRASPVPVPASLPAPDVAAGDGRVALSAAHGDIVIETERLQLRRPGIDDCADYLALMAEPEAFRYSHRGAMKGDEAWTSLLRNIGHWSSFGYGLFVVVEKASGRLVGEVGLADFRRALGAGFDRVPEAAWTIASWAHGRGYATEAAAAVHIWAGVRIHAQRTVCLIHAENAASLRVAHKLGYLPFAECEYRGYPAVLLERGWPVGVRRWVVERSARKRPGTDNRFAMPPLGALVDLVSGVRRSLSRRRHPSC